MKAYKTKINISSPVLCHLPHSSINISEQERKNFVLSKNQLDYEAKLMADLHTDIIFAPLIGKNSAHQALVSRLVVDVERFPDDTKESMSRVGMGVLYSKTSEGKELRLLNNKQKALLLKKYFQPYHLTLTSLVDKILLKHRRCIIIDCHSFPSKPRKYEPSKKTARPDICLGVDKFHTPTKFWKSIAEDFSRLGYSVQINDPFVGALVPLKFYRKNKQVHSLMIEVNRSLYMNEQSFKLKPGYKKISEDIAKIITQNI